MSQTNASSPSAPSGSVLRSVAHALNGRQTGLRTAVSQSRCTLGSEGFLGRKTVQVLEKGRLQMEVEICCMMKDQSVVIFGMTNSSQFERIRRTALFSSGPSACTSASPPSPGVRPSTWCPSALGTLGTSSGDEARGPDALTFDSRRHVARLAWSAHAPLASSAVTQVLLISTAQKALRIIKCQLPPSHDGDENKSTSTRVLSVTLQYARRPLDGFCRQGAVHNFQSTKVCDWSWHALRRPTVSG